MIKIIKYGTKPLPIKEIYTIICPTCGCEFECGVEDFKLIERMIGGDRVVSCPCCKTELHSKQLDSKHFKTMQE